MFKYQTVSHTRTRELYSSENNRILTSPVHLLDKIRYYKPSLKLTLGVKNVLDGREKNHTSWKNQYIVHHVKNVLFRFIVKTNLFNGHLQRRSCKWCKGIASPEHRNCLGYARCTRAMMNDTFSA